jgi:LmbE family N-acetylglucosaminyl deacetylase
MRERKAATRDRLKPGLHAQEGRRSETKAAFAIGAHPDDIEFYMAGTLLLLKEAGWAIHYMTLASGNCGSMEHSAQKTRAIREGESKRAAEVLGAEFHASLVDDLEILYDLKTLRRLAAVVRDVAPAIVLTHPPQDYMEDHTNTCRLAVTATFARGMPNFETTPARPHVSGDVTIYHAMPHGLRDPLRQRVEAGQWVDTTSVHAVKRRALAAHQSQKEWLDASQGMDSYLNTMDEFSREVGRMSQIFEHAEGWRRHLHLGFSATDADPLAAVLGTKVFQNAEYEKSLGASRVT